MHGAILLLLSSFSLPALAGRLERVLELEGTLAASDMKLPAGESADVYPLDLVAGNRVLVEMSSKKFDTYLVLKAPSGQVFEVDDTSGDIHFSQVDMIAEETGTWLIYATSSQAGEKGKYNIVVSMDASSTSTASAPSSGGPTPTPLSPGQSVSGELASGDATLNAGEWVDHYSIEAQAGQTLVVEMSGASLDTYLGLRAPSGEVFSNDDFEGNRNRSRIDQVVEESGTWTIYATTYQAGQGGSYTLSVNSGGGSSGPSGDGTERWSGALASGDAVLSSGEFADVIKVSGQAGERWIIDLRSAAFDPFLIHKGPDGEQHENDDFEGARDRSLLDLTLGASGEQTIAVTTYQAGQVGAYDLTLRRVVEGGTASGSQQHRGSLASGDSQLDGGEWFDTYTFEGVPGQTIRVDMRGDFDTYLGVVGPTSFRMENDDGEGSNHSRVEGVLSEAGTYRVVATSYQAGQGGAYTLDIALEQASQASAAQRDVVVLGNGTPTSGRLEEGDLTLPTGEFQDLYVLDVQAGQNISVSLSSSEFDPYVGLVQPDGSVVQNDDFEGRSDLARVDLAAPESGRYRVIATSYRVGSTGTYALNASLGAASSQPVVQATSTGEGRTYGVFMGISDYPDDGPSDLDFTADDARALYGGMQAIGMSPDDGRLLVDSGATSTAFMSAVRDLGGRMGPSDRMVIFYSGHGGRIAHNGAQASDPDGFDETVALYDRQVSDDEMAELLAGVTQGTILLVLDSCFSGGFSKDVISQPGRMGLFSSHEDVTSAVAHKFRAGGYLARFMVEAIGERRADDGDGALTALELSQYLYERYRADVKSMPQDKSGAYDDIVMTGQNLGYQQIIVDRGGVGPSSVLFAW